MRIGVVFVLAAWLPGQEQPAKPAAPKPWPIAAPDKDWFDEKRLADAVSTLRPLAEKYSGLKFTNDPVVRVADDASWAKLVAEEIPRARDADLAMAITFALFVPARDEVVLSPFMGYHLLSKDEAVAEKVDAWRALLVHELVHVLQEQHFQLPSRLRAAEDAEAKLVLKSMVEGFATWVEECVAEKEFSLAGYAARNTKMHTRNARMQYVRGRDFFSRLAEQGGEKAMHDAMRGEPMKLKDFARLALAKPAADAKPDAAPAKKGDGN